MQLMLPVPSTWRMSPRVDCRAWTIPDAPGVLVKVHPLAPAPISAEDSLASRIQAGVAPCPIDFVNVVQVETTHGWPAVRFDYTVARTEALREAATTLMYLLDDYVARVDVIALDHEALDAAHDAVFAVVASGKLAPSGEPHTLAALFAHPG